MLCATRRFISFCNGTVRNSVSSPNSSRAMTKAGAVSFYSMPTLTGTPAELQITSNVSVEDFRRYDITSGKALRLAAHCDGAYSSLDHVFQQLLCGAPVGSGLITLKGTCRPSRQSQLRTRVHRRERAGQRRGDARAAGQKQSSRRSGCRRNRCAAAFASMKNLALPPAFSSMGKERLPTFVWLRLRTKRRSAPRPFPFC